MVKRTLLMLVSSLAMGAFASDIVLDVQLNGKWLENGHHAGKIKQNGILVVQDIGADTNVYSGIYYDLGRKGKHNQVDKTAGIDVYIVSGNGKGFGMLVDIDGAQMAGTGKAIKDKDGEYRQIIISSGQGAFMYAGFGQEIVTPPGTNSTTSVTNQVLGELQVGKMQARLNKQLTTAAQDSDGENVVDAWLDLKTNNGNQQSNNSLKTNNGKKH